MSYRRPLTTATALDTGRGVQGVPSFRAYQDLSNPSVPRGIAEWATGLMDRNAQIYLSGGPAGSAFVIDGGAAGGKSAPTINLAVQDSATPGSKEAVAFLTGDRVDLSSVGRLGNLMRYAGSSDGAGQPLSAVLNGIGKTPADQPEMLIQFWNGTLTSSAFGDNTIFLPRSPSAYLWMGATTPGVDGVEWIPRNPRSNAIDMRLVNGSGATVASTSRQVSLVVIGLV